jgi:hypothetical protein
MPDDKEVARQERGYRGKKPGLVLVKMVGTQGFEPRIFDLYHFVTYQYHGSHVTKDRARNKPELAMILILLSLSSHVLDLMSRKLSNFHLLSGRE